MQVSNHHTRQRSPTDPFNDPSNITPSYSPYGFPTLSRNTQQPTHRPPPPPPKAPAKPSPRRQYPPGAPQREDIMDAVRETVTVRGSEQTPRTRMGRSQTDLPPLAISKPAPSPTTRRSHSQDSVVRAANAVEKSKPSRSRKKGSSHADVIDRLDFSGVGPMFHHDGPFDACAPSRNRHRTKAPMLAWTEASAADKDALAAAQEISPSSYESPYPSPAIYAPYEPPKKKHDAIAEAWGIHEPEPFEDFSAGGGYSARASGEYGASARSNGNGTMRRAKDGRDPRDVYREYLEDAPPPSREGRRQQTKRTIPPPQPIFVPDGDVDVPEMSPTSGGPSSPRRNKSIMHRIRKMRDSPNVPVGYDDDGYGTGRDQSPPSSAENSGVTHATALPRPTHRSQASFLGRFGRAANTGAGQPASPSDETYVYVDPMPLRKEKSLPATPAKGGTPSEENAAGYFEGSPGGAGLGRRASLLKKVKGVVKGGAAK